MLHVMTLKKIFNPTIIRATLLAFLLHCCNNKTVLKNPIQVGNLYCCKSFEASWLILTGIESPLLPYLCTIKMIGQIKSWRTFGESICGIYIVSEIQNCWQNCDLFERLFETKLFSSTLKPYNWQALYPVIMKKKSKWKLKPTFMLCSHSTPINVYMYRNTYIWISIYCRKCRKMQNCFRIMNENIKEPRTKMWQFMSHF